MRGAFLLKLLFVDSFSSFMEYYHVYIHRSV